MILRRPNELSAADFPLRHRPFADFSEVEPLLKLCAAGKLYEVEAWIADGRPLQYAPSEDRKLQRRPTALQIAIRRGFHSLAALLLANGYDPNGDYYECLSPAVRGKDLEMVQLLLRFGANPQFVDFCTVLETCDRTLMDLFVTAGVDPCKDNAVARAVDSKRRPILGFIKQYRDRFPEMQRQVDIALHVATAIGTSRGVALMLWLGGDPHAEVPSSAYEGDSNGIGATAFETALWRDKSDLVTAMLKRPIPKSKVDSLLRLAAFQCRPDLVERLLKEGADPNSLDEDRPLLYSFINCLLWRHTPRSADEQDRGLKALNLALAAGAKWNIDERAIKWLRRDLAGGESRVVVRIVELLREYDAMSPEQLHELTRTPAVRKVLAGHTKPPRHPYPGYVVSPPAPPAPTPASEPPRRGYWKRHWSQR